MIFWNWMGSTKMSNNLTLGALEADKLRDALYIWDCHIILEEWFEELDEKWDTLQPPILCLQYVKLTFGFSFNNRLLEWLVSQTKH